MINVVLLRMLVNSWTSIKISIVNFSIFMVLLWASMEDEKIQLVFRNLICGDIQKYD